MIVHDYRGNRQAIRRLPLESTGNPMTTAGIARRSDGCRGNHRAIQWLPLESSGNPKSRHNWQNRQNRQDSTL